MTLSWSYYIGLVIDECCDVCRSIECNDTEKGELYFDEFWFHMLNYSAIINYVFLIVIIQGCCFYR